MRVVVLPRTGMVAFSIIIAMAGITGVLTLLFFSQAAPGPLFTSPRLFQRSLYNGPPSGELKGGGATGGGSEQQSGSNSTGQNKTAATPPNAVTISILQGASTQGNPAYDLKIAKASIDKTIVWKNDDSTVHTATAQDESFDSSIINPGDTYTIPAKKIGAGKHQYSCTMHPCMKGTIVIK